MIQTDCVGQIFLTVLCHFPEREGSQGFRLGFSSSSRPAGTTNLNQR